MLAHEAAAANRVKEQLAATVVVGNPPYSGVSNNMFPWIDGLLKGQLPDGTVVKSYYQVDGKPLGEKKLWLQDDYVKFIRFGQWRVECSGVGVLGFITNHGYVDNPTFRGMRQCLMKSFQSIEIIDLHGNSKKKERSPDGSADINVFEIEQGVAIGLMRTSANQFFRHADVFGSRASKYESLLTNRIALSTRVPKAPNYVYSPLADVASHGYESLWSIPSITPLYGLGFQTSRDDLVVAFSSEDLDKKISRFVDPRITDAEIRKEFFGEKKVADYDSGDTRQWSLEAARQGLMSKQWRNDIKNCTYRPFDTRAVLFRDDMVDWPRPEVLGHLARPNHALLTNRQTKDDFAVFWSTFLTERKIAARYDASSTFPLWLYSGKNRTANISSAFLSNLQSALSLSATDYRPEDLTAPLHAEKIFHYLYAVLHSPAYRQRYAAFLRTDFPRIPIPGSRKVFDALAKLGADLVAWHLLEHPDATNIVAGGASSARATAWFGTDFSLMKVAEKSRELAEVHGTDDKVGKVFINVTSGFANVHQSIWQHTIGGYQVLHKWLDDRRKAGRSLSQDDITHWLRVYAALQATQKLMGQVDEAIEANGGWPGAFSQSHPPPDAATLAAEQMTQKEQLKAQKKATSATKKRAAVSSPTGATSLFDFDDDLDALAAASGAPPRPKPRATPAAKAAGGKASGSAAAVDGLNDGLVMCAIRRVLVSAGSGGVSRDGLIRSIARELGFARTSPALKAMLDTAVRRAVRRGIAQNSGAVLTLLVRDIEGYSRDHLKAQFLAAMRAAGNPCPRADAPRLLARTLGYSRTGAGVAALVESLLRSLVRAKQVESRAGQLRVVRAGGRA